MAKVSLELIQQLRERTGVGMMDCKKALEETDGNIEKAVELLRKKGAAVAQKRAGHATAEGLVHAYIHPGAHIGTLLQISCETDFVARTRDLAQFAQDVCMHIAAMNPLCIRPDDLDPAYIEKEKEIIREQLKMEGKPAAIVEKIIDGKMQKVYSEKCLLSQPFVKNDQVTIKELLEELIAKLGENIKIERFARFEVGT